MLELNIEYKEAKPSPIKATLKHQIESRENQVDRTVSRIIYQLTKEDIKIVERD